MSEQTGSRSSPGARRAGYVVAVLVNAVLLWLVNVYPGWQALPFLTDDVTDVLPWVNVSLAASLAANLVYLVTDAPRVLAAGQMVLSAIALAVTARLLAVFPFDFSAYTVDWALVTRVVLVVALLGSAVGVVAGLVRLVAPRGLSVRRG